FYTVYQCQKISTPDYEPTIALATFSTKNSFAISISDNGIGVPHQLVDKIFQPFFTTKPTGEGTGLGLSLSYDIIKSYGGEIKLETREGKGSTFTIIIPTN
ncbi:MAG: ATP-binding protein, partial [Chitinophagaceae bacterium]